VFRSTSNEVNYSRPSKHIPQWAQELRKCGTIAGLSMPHIDRTHAILIVFPYVVIRDCLAAIDFHTRIACYYQQPILLAQRHERLFADGSAGIARP
jgi:hypothetical protein